MVGRIVGNGYGDWRWDRGIVDRGLFGVYIGGDISLVISVTQRETREGCC